MGGGGRSSPPGSVREIGTYTAYSEKKDSAGVNGVQMEAGAPTVHTYTEARNTCTPPHPPPSTSSSMHFIYNNVFLQGIHLSALFSSHFCHIFFIRFSSAGPFFFFFFHLSFTVPPELNGEPSRNNKY